MGIQVINLLEKLHSLGYIHGDIKPQNILFSSNTHVDYARNLPNSKPKFTLIDFGISDKYVNNQGVHLSKEKMKSFKGNIEFAAVECLQKYRKY